MPTVEALVHIFETNYNETNTREIAEAIHREVTAGTLSAEELRTHLTSMLSTRWLHGVNDTLKSQKEKDSKPSTSKVTKRSNKAV